MYQQVTIIGFLGKDPVMSYTDQGIALCKFTVATSKVTGKGEDKKESTVWWNISAWREQAETLSQWVKKGQRIMIVGEVTVSAYMNKEGRPAASLELTVRDFKFLSDKPADGSSAAPGRAEPSFEPNGDTIPF